LCNTVAPKDGTMPTKQPLVFFLLLATLATNGQPLPRNCYARFFDTTGTQVNYATFCSHYDLLGKNNRDDLTPCTNEVLPPSGFYDSTTSTFDFGGSVIYGHLIRKLVHGQDTMVLRFNSLENAVFFIDSLVFRAGSFFIKELKKPFLNHHQAAVDYYNLFLYYILSLRGEYHTPLDDQMEAELLRLKVRYGIAFDDDRQKTVEVLFETP
jgi:hypothetical protein